MNGSKLVYGWNFILTAEDIDSAVANACKLFDAATVFTATHRPSKKAYRGSVDEVPLIGASPSRNAKGVLDQGAVAHRGWAESQGCIRCEGGQLMPDFFGPKESQALRKRLGDQDLGKLSEQEEHAINERMAATDKFFRDQVKAKYKLEVQFYEKRSTIEPFAGVMSFLLSGNRLHGGGDRNESQSCKGLPAAEDPTYCQVVDLDANALMQDLSKIPLKVVA